MIKKVDILETVVQPDQSIRKLLAKPTFEIIMINKYSR